MNSDAQWLIQLGESLKAPRTEGLVLVADYDPSDRPPEEVAMMEKATAYGAHSVFFEAERNGRPPVAQALIYISGQHSSDSDRDFAHLHKRLWSWGGVPLVYRKIPGEIQLFRCAHDPDFVGADGRIVCRPAKTLKIAAEISDKSAWWDASQLRNGTLWDDPSICAAMLSAKKAAHKRLIDAVRNLHANLNAQEILTKRLRRKLLIISLLVAYLEEREVFLHGYFAKFLPGADRFFEVMGSGCALVDLLSDLEERFNGHTFALEDADREVLKKSTDLDRCARLIEGRQEANGQLTLWQLYSFRDLPVELISHIYQLFVKDADTAVYTPPYLVRLMMEEALSWDRIDRLYARGEIILDPSCGSGVFLVEAYKRLVLHWRSRNKWLDPDVPVLKGILSKVHGIDYEEDAVELAAFSLCLALCDALKPEQIRATIKLFPPLRETTLHHSCFFEAIENGLVRQPVGIILGNPPFASKLGTAGSRRAYERYEKKFGKLPDKQIGYLFLHEAMGMISAGGILSMLQQYNFLYNKNSSTFRADFLERWDVREILDFVSVRGLFQKGSADTKVVVIVAVAESPPNDRRILHATFRRSGRVDAEQGFDIDHYDLHWMPRALVAQNDGVWRANLLGGGRVLAFADRLRKYQTLGEFAAHQGWDFGEGFIEGCAGVSRPADHIIGHPLLPSKALTLCGLDNSAITVAEDKPIEGPRSEKRFTPPMLLIREQMDLPHAVWTDSYLTYKNQIVGFAAPADHKDQLTNIGDWISENGPVLRAYVAAVSVKLFTQKATTLSGADVLALPFPEGGSLELSENEGILVDDIITYQRDIIRLGDKSPAFNIVSLDEINLFANAFCRQINTVYESQPVHPLIPHFWPGVVCQPFVFGPGTVDWEGSDGLKGKIDRLLLNESSGSLRITRIARLYDDRFLFLIKPDRMRYWLRSIALRDADEVLSDLREQGF